MKGRDVVSPDAGASDVDQESKMRPKERKIHVCVQVDFSRKMRVESGRMQRFKKNVYLAT